MVLFISKFSILSKLGDLLVPGYGGMKLIHKPGPTSFGAYPNMGRHQKMGVIPMSWGSLSQSKRKVNRQETSTILVVVFLIYCYICLPLKIFFKINTHTYKPMVRPQNISCILVIFFSGRN